VRGPLTKDTTAYNTQNSTGHTVRAEPHFGEVLWYSTNKQQQEIKMPMGKKGKKKRYSSKRITKR